MSPFLFRIPSTLYTGHGLCSHLIGSHSSLAYFILMKFSVAPESRSAVVSALFQDRWMNKCNCIDFCIEKYILSDPILLIQAAQIRPPKNFPPGLPIESWALLGRPLGALLIAGRWSPLLWCWSHFHYLLDSNWWVVRCVYWHVSV